MQRRVLGALKRFMDFGRSNYLFANNVSLGRIYMKKFLRLVMVSGMLLGGSVNVSASSEIGVEGLLADSVVAGTFYRTYPCPYHVWRNGVRLCVWAGLG